MNKNKMINNTNNYYNKDNNYIHFNNFNNEKGFKLRTNDWTFLKSSI